MASRDDESRIVSDALEVIRDKYVSDVDTRKLAFDAVRGMMKNLDRYSEFLGPDQMAAFQEETEGEFGGIGIVIDDPRKGGPGVRVAYPIKNSPAERAGIRSGDRLLAADNQPIGEVKTTDDLNRLLHRLKGKPGTSVRVSVESPGAAARDVVLVRERIHVNSVRGPSVLDPEAGIGYVRLRGFQENTVKDLDNALDWLEKRSIRSLILDLRFNPGGLLKTAVDVADRFLSNGLIVSTRGRDALSNVE